MVVIRKMLHNIFNTAVENIAELIDGVYFYIFVLAQTVNLGSVYIVMGV